MADANLRRLVENASLLDSAAIAASRSPAHLLGGKVRSGKFYGAPTGRVPLPAREQGLSNLRESQTHPILGLDPDCGLAAWGTTIDKSFLAMHLPTPDLVELAQQGIVLPDGWHSRVRRVALANIFELPSIAENAHDGRRFGAGAELTILLDPQMKHADDAWVAFEWKLGTVAMAVWLERQLASLSEQRVAKSTVAGVTILIHPELAKSLSGLPVDAVRLAAAAFGLRARVIDLANVDFGHARAALSRESTKYLLAIGPSDARIATLMDVGFAAGSKQMTVAPGLGDDLLVTMREAFASLTDVGLELVALPEPVAASEVAADRGLPIKSATECMHDDFDRYYTLEADSGLWWTVDTAGHGGSKFKTYTKSGSSLHHEACRDEHGSVIPKWKGLIGLEISISDLHGCSRPESHLRQNA